MTATAKLRTLLEAADSGNPIELGEDMAWKLARLVLTLAEALTWAQDALHDSAAKSEESCSSVCDDENCVHQAARKALAAVEELRL